MTVLTGYNRRLELAIDVQRHLSNEPVVAGPPSKSYRIRKFVRRNSLQVIAAAIVAATLLLGIVGTTGGLLWALDEKQRAEGAGGPLITQPLASAGYKADRQVHVQLHLKKHRLTSSCLLSASPAMK